MTLDPEQLQRMGRGLLRERRLEDHSSFVVPVKTGSSTLAVPLFGGKEGMRLLAATTQGVLEAQDWLDERELTEIEVTLVTDRSLA